MLHWSTIALFRAVDLSNSAYTNENCAIFLTSHLTATNSSGKYDAVFAIDAGDGKVLAEAILNAVNIAMETGGFPADTQAGDIRFPFRNGTTLVSLRDVGGSICANSWAKPSVYDADCNAMDDSQINNIMPGTPVAFAVDPIPYAVDTNIGIRLELSEIMLLPPGTGGTPAYLSAQKRTFTLEDFKS